LIRSIEDESRVDYRADEVEDMTTSWRLSRDGRQQKVRTIATAWLLVFLVPTALGAWSLWKWFLDKF
jgi:hypothetical protein